MSNQNAHGFFEEPEWFQEFDVIIGIDEVGRGALAGPLYASAVALTADDYKAWLINGPVIKDSKKMSRKARAVGCLWMEHIALISETAWVSAQDIDRHGISWANKDAMQRALDGCRAKVSANQRVKVISDHVPLITQDAFESFPRAETRSFAVACASVCAKEQRDTYMKKCAQLYSNYAWESNVGYGTRAHCEAIRQHGPTGEHRRSFIANYLD